MVASAAVSKLLARWAHFYGHTPVSATITYFHLVGILVGGGVAVAADRASLRLSPTTPHWSQELARLASVHRWVVAGLALIFASGLLMMLAQLDTLRPRSCSGPRWGSSPCCSAMATYGCERRTRSDRVAPPDGVGSGGHRSQASCCGWSSSCSARCSTPPPDGQTRCSLPCSRLPLLLPC